MQQAAAIHESFALVVDPVVEELCQLVHLKRPTHARSFTLAWLRGEVAPTAEAAADAAEGNVDELMGIVAGGGDADADLRRQLAALLDGTMQSLMAYSIAGQVTVRQPQDVKRFMLDYLEGTIGPCPAPTKRSTDDRPLPGATPRRLSLSLPVQRRSHWLDASDQPRSVGAGEGCDIRVEGDAALNEVHARVAWDDSELGFVMTEMAGASVARGAVFLRLTRESAPQRVAVGTTLRLGEFALEITALSSAGGCTATLTALEDGSSSDTTFSLAEGATVGRAGSNTIQVPDAKTSGKHCRFELDRAQGCLVVRDVGSTNGTLLRIPRRRLVPGDNVVMGGTLCYVTPQPVGVHSDIGTRPSLEDAHTILSTFNVPGLAAAGPGSLFAVFDGHGGAEVARHVAAHLHTHLQTALEGRAKAIMQGLRADAAAAAASVLAALDGSGGSGGSGGAAAAPPAEESKLSESKLAEIAADNQANQANQDDDEEVKLIGDDEPEKDDPALDAVREAFSVAFQACDTEAIESVQSDSGSTGVVALMIGVALFVGNVGDSRAVLCRDGVAVDLSVDHKASRPEEVARIEAAGGVVFRNRVMGQLAVSRAFGDCSLKVASSKTMTDNNITDPLVICTPELQRADLTADDDFLLLACDGLFDVMTSQEACEWIKERLVGGAAETDVCEALVTHAIRDLKSRDNVTAMIVPLRDLVGAGGGSVEPVEPLDS